ncbi:hypothetical protein SAMN06298212_12621 [Ruaniaceae bacterium KH17]|nr:hypothetical protein SAMN06298212_12621 [Ruaniaceae bacterium KH17]
MFVRLSIFTPHAEYRDAQADSMRRFGAAIAGREGVISIRTMLDEASGRLVGIAIFESEEAANALLPLAQAAVADDDFDTWAASETDGLRLVDITHPR